MKVFIVNAEEKEAVREQIQDAKNEIDRIMEMIERGESPPQNDDPMMEPPGPPFGIVLNGHSLVSRVLNIHKITRPPSIDRYINRI